MMGIVLVAGLIVAAKWGWLRGVLVIMAGYAGSCRRFPLARCPICSGRGKHRRDDAKVFRRCSWCSGSGARRRVGPVVYDTLSG